MKKLSRAAAFLSIVVGTGLLSAQIPSAPPPPLPTAASDVSATVEAVPDTESALEVVTPTSLDEAENAGEKQPELEPLAAPILAAPSANQDVRRRITILELPRDRGVEPRNPAAIQTQKLIHDRERQWAAGRRAIIDARKRAGISVSRPNGTDVQRYGRYQRRTFYSPSGLEVIYGFRAQSPVAPY